VDHFPEGRFKSYPRNQRKALGASRIRGFLLLADLRAMGEKPDGRRFWMFGFDLSD